MSEATHLLLSVYTSGVCTEDEELLTREAYARGLDAIRAVERIDDRLLFLRGELRGIEEETDNRDQCETGVAFSHQRREIGGRREHNEHNVSHNITPCRDPHYTQASLPKRLQPAREWLPC